MAKKFCGSAKIITTQFGPLTKGSFNQSDLKVLTDNLNEKGWVNWVIKEKKEKVEGKPTHYIEIDDYKPMSENQVNPVNNDFTNDLPFN